MTAGASVVVPELEQVVARDVGLVAERDERRHAEIEPPGQLEERRPERSRLHRHAHRAGLQRSRREVGQQRRFLGGREDTHAAGPDDPHAVAPRHGDELGGGIVIGHRREDDRAPHALATARRDHVPERLDGHRDDGEGHVVLDGIDRLVAHEPRDLLTVRVHGVDGTGERALDHVPQHGPADRARPVRRTDHGDGAWVQEPGDGAAVADLLAPFERVEERRGLLQVPRQIDDTALEGPPHRPSRFREHREHRPVVAQHLGREPRDAHRDGERRKVLEQQRGDAATVVRVVGEERDVGVVTTGPPIEAPPGDQLVAVLDHEPGSVLHVDVREPLGLLLGEPGSGREVPVVQALAALAGVERDQRVLVARLDRADVDGQAVGQDHIALPGTRHLVVTPSLRSRAGRSSTRASNPAS